ncbi:hypothetical protein BC826DRAFT_986401 [Russula brevipes]|nr:hypothetical protein BC826DRAFT_1076344 [Russula brevipes]KAI0280454.1 hypothetical protein BC826DRAFT_1075373 [Russula brevipes]KAI0301974.1 hypothetical protein BC826DRAFT_986401 [Russula brevipes]
MGLQERQNCCVCCACLRPSLALPLLRPLLLQVHLMSFVREEHAASHSSMPPTTKFIKSHQDSYIHTGHARRTPAPPASTPPPPPRVP